MGAGYMLREHFDLVKNACTVINEGGRLIAQTEGAPPYPGLTNAEKNPLWLKLTATGTPGHGSTPLVQTAVTKLIAAVTRN